MVLPTLYLVPSAGLKMVAVGLVFPTVMVTWAVLDAFFESVTVKTAVNVPVLLYVFMARVGLC